MDRLGFGTNRRAAFWWCQVGGWSAYAIDRWLSEDAFFPVYFIYLCVAFALTTLFLRPLYRTVYARRPNPWVLLGIGVGLSVFAAFLWLVVSRGIFVALGMMRAPAAPWIDYLLDTFKATLVHHKPFLFLSWTGAYFGTKLWLDARDRHASALAAIATARDAELQALRAQLNPHFLFNALNSANALIQQDPVRAQQVLDKIAVFLRRALAGTTEHETRLRDEIESLRAYLDIQQMRYEGNLDARIEVSADALNCEVPPLLLQPIVENAVKYGMRTSRMPLRLEVRGDLNDHVLKVEVIHTGHLVPHDTASSWDHGQGIGLANVRRRLELALAGRHQFELREHAGEVHAIVRIWSREHQPCAS